MPVVIINKKKLSDSELSRVQEISEKYYGKLDVDYYKRLKNFELQMLVEVKKHDAKMKEGMACKYSIHARINAPATIVSSHHADWDLNKALHKAFQNMTNELNHKFKDLSAEIERAKKTGKSKRDIGL